jgi:hypothetical protein
LALELPNLAPEIIVDRHGLANMFGDVLKLPE